MITEQELESAQYTIGDLQGDLEDSQNTIVDLQSTIKSLESKISSFDGFHKLQTKKLSLIHRYNHWEVKDSCGTLSYGSTPLEALNHI